MSREAFERQSMFNLFSIPARVTPMNLECDVPVRPHKKRRNQSATYHARIQKKWVKRFGTKKEQYAALMDPSKVGLSGGQQLVMDQRSIALLRNLSAR